MSDHRNPGSGENRTPGLIVGVVLVFIGLWLLTDTIRDRFAPWVGPIFQFWREMRIWAVAGGLILIGVLVILYSGKVSLKLPSRSRPLRRSRETKMISGVLGGLSEYLDVDVTLLRIIVVALAFIMDGWGILLAYIIAAIVIPLEPEHPAPGAYAPQPPVRAGGNPPYPGGPVPPLVQSEPVSPAPAPPAPEPPSEPQPPSEPRS